MLLSAGEREGGASRQPLVRYIGFRTTAEGREYTMRVIDVRSSRDFALLITHEAFASRQASFQDAPDLCSARMRRDLAADPDLVPGEQIQLTAQDLADYRDSHPSSAVKRTRAKI